MFKILPAVKMSTILTAIKMCTILSTIKMSKILIANTTGLEGLEDWSNVSRIQHADEFGEFASIPAPRYFTNAALRPAG